MTYWQNMSPAYRARLEELAQVMLACRDAFHGTADTFHWEPVTGSPQRKTRNRASWGG
jgi:hypothetical protein